MEACSEISTSADNKLRRLAIECSKFARLPSMTEPISPLQPQSLRVCAGTVDALPEGHQTEVFIDGMSVVVIVYQGQYYALRNNCTHQKYPLLGGEVANGRITCENHGAKFELTTGKAKTLPAFRPVQIYKTEVEDGSVYVLPL